MTVIGRYLGHTKTWQIIARELEYDRHKHLANCLTKDLATVTDAQMAMEVSTRIARHLEQCRRLADILRAERGY